jgi:hypothetical protein
MNIIIIKLITDKTQNISALALERIFDEIMGVIFLDKNRGKLKTFSINMWWMCNCNLVEVVERLEKFLLSFVGYISKVTYTLKDGDNKCMYCVLVRGKYEEKEVYYVDSCWSKTELKRILNRLNGYSTNVQNIYEIYVGEETHERSN